MHRLDFKRGTVEQIDPATPPKGADVDLCPCCGTPTRVVGDAAEGTMHYEPVSTAARRELLAEIDAWLLDEALGDDADGAEWDADFYRVVRARLAEEFKP